MIFKDLAYKITGNYFGRGSKYVSLVRFESLSDRQENAVLNSYCNY